MTHTGPLRYVFDEPAAFLSPLVLRDLVVECWEPTDVGIEITYPDVPSVVWPTVVIDNVTVRGPFATGIRLRGCWNATLRDPFVSGVLTEQTHAQLEHATMQIGIDLGGSMDVHVVNPRITCARVGIAAEDYSDSGYAEGLHVSGGWIMHAVTGIRLRGYGSGGWPTPNAWIRDMHLCVTGFGVQATRYCGLHLSDLDVYTAQADAQLWGVYLADGCLDSTITNLRIWDNRPPELFSGAIVLDQSRDIVCSGQIGRGASLGLWATPSCSGISNALVPHGAFMYDQSVR